MLRHIIVRADGARRFPSYTAGHVPTHSKVAFATRCRQSDQGKRDNWGLVRKCQSRRPERVVL